MFSLITKMFNFVNVGQSPSFLSAFVFGKFILTWLKNLFSMLLDKILECIWYICRFVLGIMEAFEYMINSFLGMDSSVDDYISVARNGGFLDTFVLTFRAIIGVSIVLIIIFTIFAIVKQEINTAQQGFEGNKANNSKAGIFKNLALKIITMLILPLMMGFIVSGTNSIVVAFNRAIKGDQNVTVAGQVLSSSTYDANKYRNYANNNKRLPIVISAYDTSEYTADENTILANKIASYEVQTILKTTAGNLNAGNGISFKDALTYKNNKLANSSNFGSYYENFICTPEQYQVMADFVDYVEKSGENFYIKAIDDPDIEWKYVDSSIYDKTNNSLTIRYRDASDLDSDGSTKDTYTITYSMSYDVTSPISDALESIMALLGVGEYSDYTYKVMERDEDYVNLVQWANEKVQIKLSSTFNIKYPETWTPVDELIVYEYYHFSSNNTFSDYTLSQIQDEGVLLDAKQIVYRQYYPEADAYSDEKTIECVLINGTYYRVELSDSQMDKYGNKYYVLSSDGTKFLKSSIIEIEEADKDTVLKTSQNFDLNDTSSWTYTDQIIAYEYYKDLSYTNILSKYKFSQFAYNDSGVNLPTYNITVGGSTKTYVLINGTYYSVTRGNPSDFYSLESVSGGKFLVDTGTTLSSFYDYTFKLEAGVEEIYGISGTVGPETFYATTITDYKLLEPDDESDGGDDVISGYEKYSSVSFSLSNTFDYKNVETWSYRDYFYFYLYITHPGIVNSLSELQYMGLTGDLCTGKLPGESEDSYLFRVNVSSNYYIYLDIDAVNMISELNMYSFLDVEETIKKTYYDSTENNLFVTFDSATDVLVTSETNYKTFNFSDSFNEYSISTWTVEDLLLMLLSTDGVINSVEDIAESGYSSLVYSTTRNGGDKLYRFGKNYSASQADRTIYLSENAVKANYGYNSITGWLRTNAIDFIAKLMDTTSSELVTSFEGIINSIYASNRDVIYTLSDLITTIVEDEMYEEDGVAKIFNKAIKYTYTNSTLDTKTLSTWNILDTLIYYLTGKSVATYESYVIDYNGKSYFIIGDYAVNISDESVFKSAISEQHTLISASLAISGSKKTSDLMDYYQSKGLSSKVTEISAISSQLIKLYDATYVYHPTTAVTQVDVVDNNDISNVSGFTYLDIIMLNILGELKTEDYEFNVYTDGLNNYILVGDKCVSISILGESSDILCKTTGKLELDNKVSVFTYTGTDYTAFRNIDNEDETTKYSSYTNLDSVIYNITKSTTKKAYNIYEYTDTGSGAKYQFIPVANNKGVITYVEYKEENSREKLASELNNEYNSDAQIKALYDNYYKQYYTNVLDHVLTGGEETGAIIDFNGFQLSNILTWTPIRVILYVNNIMVNYSTENKIEVQVIKATTNSVTKTYLHFTEVNTATGSSKEHYIDITTLATVDSDSLQAQESAETLYQMYLQLMLFKNVDEKISTPSETVATYTTFNTFIRNTLCATSFLSKHVDSASSFRTKYVSTFDQETPGTWTWFDLIYYYLNGNARTSEKTYVYTNSQGDKYVPINYGDGGKQTIYLKVNEDYITDTFATSLKEVTFNANESLEPLGIIVYKLTGVDGTSRISEITIGGTGEVFYNIKHATEDVYYGVLGLGTTSSIENTISTDTYSYTTSVETDDSIFDFGVIDFFYAYSYATLTPANFESNIYKFNNTQYILIGENYINIDLLKTNYINIDEANKKLTNNKSLKNVVCYGDGFGTDYSNALIVFDLNEVPSDLVTATTAGETEVEVEFSKTFKPNDISTWTVSDFFIYYFYQYSDNSNKCYDETNFQTFINNGYMIAKDYIMIQSDEFGNSKSVRVLQFGDGTGSYLYCNYEVFMMLYNRKLTNPVKETYSASDAPIKLELLAESSGNPNSPSHLEYLIVSDIIASDFEYLNYYFFKFGSSTLVSGNTGLEDDINDGLATEGKTINLRLSDDFDINDTSSWTILDYIIIYESTRKVNHNFFEGMSFSELKNNDNYYFLYTLEGSDKQVLEINGNTYDFSATGMLVLQSGDESTGDDVYTVELKDTNLVTEGSVNSYNFKIIAETYRYSINDSDSKTFVIEDNKNSISYYITDETDSSKKTQLIRTLDVYAVEELYQIDMTNPEWSEPIVSSIVREVNWPQKLMTDMQVLYPDLNWEVLIATDGWLDTLGEFTSANATGEYISSGNSANITAVGLVLSEFFISVAKESEKGYAEYEYESVFDEQTIKSLMLAMLGEYEYEQLTFQAQIFMDLFNSTFAPVLEDIAKEKGIEIVDGKVDNFTMSVYKSYLATVILSSDFGEYLYKVATRVYAQYSIYEFLANASGDYAGYYAYINGHLDENGEAIDAFTYSSFYELVKYENNISKTKTPTFTFNYANVYRALVNANATDEEIQISLNRFDGTDVTRAIIQRVLEVKTDWDADEILDKLDIESINDVISNDTLSKFADLIPGVDVSDLHITIRSYQEVLGLLDEKYNNIYMSGKTIPDNSELYCFMLEAYWSMRYEYKLTGSSFKLFPSYLQLYYKYIMGEIQRWSIMDEVSINDTSKYMKYYELYSAQLLLGKAQLLTAMIPMFTIQDVDIKVDTDDGISSLRDLISSVDLSVATPYSILHDVFKSSNTYSGLLKTALSNSVSVTYWAVESQQGDNEAWLNLLNVADAVEKILEEFGKVKAMSPGGMNENGSEKVDKYTDEVYENTYKLLSDYNQKFQNYVNAQKMVDKITKGSITYTLAQFGHNYVSAGYNFVLENRNYTLQSTVSSSRLAEYVYGGDYLVQFGINPTFTSSTFEGIAEHVMVFDPKDNAVKAKLAIWEELREFAQEIADYTAELYFTTNMIDLSENKSDAILMTDYLNVKSLISGEYQETTLEYAILEYLLYSEDVDISADTFISLIFGDTIQSLENLKNSGATINQDVLDLARYLENDLADVTLENGDTHTNIFVELQNNATALEEKKISTLLEYIRFVQSNAYTSAGYYNVDRNNPNDRIHLMFVNVMKYFMINEGETGKVQSKVSFENLTFKQFKQIVIEFLISYTQNPSETPTENASRYLALFNLVISQFTYSLGDVGTTVPDEYGRTISQLYVKRDADTDTVKYVEGFTEKYIFADFSIDAATENSILALAGVANRPLEDLVNLEYDELYDMQGNYDEAKGDTFIACFYDEILGKYIPYMATNATGYNSNGNFAKYMSDYGYRIYTDYYDDDRYVCEAYPIVVKGIITASGLPTAIKIEDYEVKFYRTDITATMSLNDGALQQTKVVHESNTVGFNNYVDTTYSGAGGVNNYSAMFIGSADMSYFLESDFSAQFIQINKEYNLSKDDYGGISVLDDFSAFYKMETQSYLLLILAFIVMIPMLFKSTASVLRRVLDLLFLILAAPLSISMSALNLDESGSKGGNKMFTTWKDNMTKAILSVFGYVVGFNIYYVLITTITGMTFVSEATVLKVQSIGGLSFVTGSLLNSVIRYMFILAAGGAIKTSSRMLGSIVSAGKVQDAFVSALDGSDTMGSIGKLGGEIKQTLNKAKDIYSGKALLQAKDFAIEGAKQMVPGATLMGGAVNGVRTLNNYRKSKSMSRLAQESGVPKEYADKAAKQFRDNANKQRQLKQEKRRDSAREFQTFMGVDKDGLMNERSSKKRRTEKEKKQKKKETSKQKAYDKAYKKTEKKNKKKAKKGK